MRCSADQPGRGCRIDRNGLVGGDYGHGLFLCWNAQHGTYADNVITRNRLSGIAIGHRDSNNLSLRNTVRRNGQAGVLCPEDTLRTYNNVFRECLIEDNGHKDGGRGVVLVGDAHHTTFADCTIRDRRPAPKKTQRVGLHIGPGVKDVKVRNCTIEGNAERDVQRVRAGGAKRRK